MVMNQQKLLPDPTKADSVNDSRKASILDFEKQDTQALDAINKTIEEDSYTYSILLRELLTGAVPTMIQIFGALFVNNTTMHFLGQKGNHTLLNGISMANNFLTGLSYFIILHLNVGLGAAASQAYGARQYKLVGLYLHRALIIHMVFAILGYLVFFNANHIFNLMNVPSDIAQVGSTYLMWSPLYILSNIVFDTVKNYLYAHGIFNSQVFCQLFISGTYWFIMQHMFTHKLITEKNIMISLSACQAFGALMLIAYVSLLKPAETSLSWFRFQRESLSGVWSFFKVIAAIGSMGYIEILAYRIQAFAAVYFPEAQMTAYVSFLAFDDLYYILPVGLAISLTTLIGRAMGSRDKMKIHRVIKIAFAVGIVLLVTMLILFFFCHKHFFNFYTKDAEVKEILMQIAYVYYAFFVADFFQGLSAGVLKGVGKEHAGTKAFVLCLYLVALPLSLFLAFYVKLNAVGLWLGVAIGMYFVISSYIGIYVNTDLDEQFEYVTKRMENTQ